MGFRIDSLRRGLGLGGREYQPGDWFCIGYDEKIERKIVVVIEVSNVP